MILLVNGPNLNLLGEREPEVYGADTLGDVERLVERTCAAYGVEVRAFQSNSEGALLDFIQAHRHEARGIILNPGALTHTSYALHDCLKAVRAPAVEVHVSNVHAREAWRRTSVISPAAKGVVAGLGVAGYRLAATWLCERIAADAARGEPVGPPVRTAAARPVPPGPSPGHEGASGGGWLDRGDRSITVSDADLETPADQIPVSLTKRGDYEPL